MHFKRKFIAAVTLILIFCSSSSDVFSKSNENITSGKKVILIDPGHGGYDGGADGKTGIKEKDLNLSIGLKLRDKLAAEGYQVVMTREKDEALIVKGDNRYKTKKAQDLANRIKIKKDTNPDLFISIHQNYFPEEKYSGSQVWYSNYKDSKTFAHLVQENLRVDLNKENNRVEKPARDDYKMLRVQDTMPSILIECGFMSNYNEELKLKDEKYQEMVASSIVKSIKAFLKES